MFARGVKDLVDGAGHFVAAEGRNYAFDLPPVAEARDIAVAAAALATDSRLDPGIVAITFDELGGVGQSDAAMDEGAIHAPFLRDAPFPDCGRSSSTGR